jgi:hypothetical protein
MAAQLAASQEGLSSARTVREYVSKFLVCLCAFNGGHYGTSIKDREIFLSIFRYAIAYLMELG